MKLTVTSFENGATIPDEFVFGLPAEEGHVRFGPNRNPHLRWTDLPEGTQSLALFFIDADVPSVGTDVNQEGRTVPYDLPRVDFYHWVLVDIPPSVTELEVGQDSEGVTERGKQASRTSYGVRGLNSYCDWFAGDPDMAGEYGGYDGPCPPWNDERVHKYYLTLYALDEPSLNLESPFTGSAALKTMEGHILDTAEWSGKYAIYSGARE